MASDQKIAANRRNARKSTGPKSARGKQRAARNALRHGLTINAGVSLDCETLSAQISGDTTDEFILERARVAARAQLDLARIRQIKTAMLNRAYAFGTHELQQRFRTTREVKLFLGLSVCTEPPQPPVTMSLQGPERVAEVVQRLIPELHKLNGYERRAWATRNRALREISWRRCRM